MRVSNLGLDYSAGPGIEPRTVHVQPPKANMHRIKDTALLVNCNKIMSTVIK